MKNIKYIKLSIASLLGLSLIVFSSCERDPSDEAVPATFGNTAEVFTDNPVNITDDFFKSFDPATGANVNGFGVDENEAYEGTTAIRIEVPAPNDPDGGYIGGIFRDRGTGRDLTGYTALTFWARASVPTTNAEFGFGTDFLDGQYPVSGQFALTTGWKQYIVPMPDPSVYTQELGMFLFSLNSATTGGLGYTVWIDEIRFENLGTIAQPRPAIFGGQDETNDSFIGVSQDITGLTYTANLPDGTDQTVSATAALFDFSSSDIRVASVDSEGVVTLLSEGTATITATLANVRAEGSLTVNVTGEFIAAPVPTEDASDVISIFSDAYTNIPVSRYNSFFEPFQTTLGGVQEIGPESIIRYTELNFVGIVFNTVIFPSEAVPEVDATGFTHLHIDVNIQEDPGTDLTVELTDFGNPADDGDNLVGTYVIPAGDLQNGTWVSFDIPLTDFSGLTRQSAIGLLLFNTSSPISEVLIDNIYFYK